MVQWLGLGAFTAVVGSICGWRTKSPHTQRKYLKMIQYKVTIKFFLLVLFLRDNNWEHFGGYPSRSFSVALEIKSLY